MKIDLHVHTSEVSLCGKLSAHDTMALYKEKGYDAVVITNHFNNDTARHYANLGKPDFFRVYKDAYLLAKAEGEALGIRVFNGCEIRFDENYNDYLVYGLPDEIAADFERICKMSSREFSELCKANGALFYQAHPFRNHMTVQNPAILFGIEIKNGNPRHDSRNDIAAAWAEKYGLHKIAGSDCHQTPDAGGTGVITARDIKNEEDLVEMLRADDYTII